MHRFQYKLILLAGSQLVIAVILCCQPIKIKLNFICNNLRPAVILVLSVPALQITYLNASIIEMSSVCRCKNKL